MRILNLYAGIGGNRKLWPAEHLVTAVEFNPKIAAVYQGFYPQDTVIIGDAHQYLLDHWREFDFIWSSPPCPSHSTTNGFLCTRKVGPCIRYPDMSLWQEIVFLKARCKTKWVVENVRSYYPPLWPPTILDRHYFWSNFAIPPMVMPERPFRNLTERSSKDGSDSMGVGIPALEKWHGIVLPSGTTNGRLLLRNCVHPPVGLHILEAANAG